MVETAGSRVSPPAEAGGRAEEPRKPILDPVERTSEILFGLIMALTFTSAVGVAGEARDEIRMLLVGALACNVAWGLVDGVMYLLGCLATRALAHRTAVAFRAAVGPEEARRVMIGALPTTLVAGLDPQTLEAMRTSFARSSVMPPTPKLHADDWKGALGVFLLVTLSTFPLVLPFVFMSDPRWALRVSNGIALAMLWIMGAAFGRASGYRSWITGSAMVALGVVLVAVTIALGG
jgi:VIT1/CCC1 family predicted Fe2+/Mn2+ transporter